jgi:hypothetical protein
MDRVVAALKLQGKRVAVTASTGIAGVLIGGSTVHSWAGIGLGVGLALFTTLFCSQNIN